MWIHCRYNFSSSVRPDLLAKGRSCPKLVYNSPASKYIKPVHLDGVCGMYLDYSTYILEGEAAGIEYVLFNR